MIIFSIVVYSDFEVTLRFIKNIINLSLANYQIIILDNYIDYNESIQENILIEIEKVNRGSEKIKYLFSESNLGYGAGNNYIFNYAVKNKLLFDYFIVSNSDIKINSKDDINKLLEILKSNPKIGAIGPQIILSNSKKQGPFIYQSIFKRYISLMFYPILKIFNNEFYDESVVDDISGIYYRLMGCFLILRKDDYESINGFDENIFLYGEELVLSEKLKKINKDCYYERSVIIKHDHNTTTSKYYDQIKRKKMEFSSLIYYYRNYRNVSNIEILFSRIGFCLYIKIFYRLQNVLKQLIKKQ